MTVPTVPNYRHVPEKLYATGLYDLTTHDGLDAFVDACVATLNGIDPNFKHLKKKASQTHRHRHGEDSVLYLLPNNRALAVDFTIGAGGPNPKPGWNVGDFVYTHADAHDPDDHGIGTAAPPAVATLPDYEALGGDAFFRAMVGVPLEADYVRQGEALNEGSAVWFSRTVHSLMVALVTSGGRPVDVHGVVKRHRNEWRVILGLPVLP